MNKEKFDKVGIPLAFLVGASCRLSSPDPNAKRFLLGATGFLVS